MRLEHVDDSVLVASHPLHNRFTFFVPEEDVGAVGAGHDELALRAEEVDAFDGRTEE